MVEWTATKDEIDLWITELIEQCNAAEFQDAYKAGWRDALIGLRVKMDKARRGSS